MSHWFKFSSNAKTIFKQASGGITIDKSRDNKFKIDISAPAINGIFTGQLNIIESKISGLANIIFLTGDRKKQVPINIATNITGSLNNISQNTNLDQAKQYLGIMPRVIAPSQDAPPIDLDQKDQSSIMNKTVIQGAVMPKNRVGQRFDQIDSSESNAINAAKNVQARQPQPKPSPNFQ